MFDGAAVVDAVDHVTDDGNHDSSADALTPAAVEPPASAQPERREVAFVDSAVSSSDVLVNGMRAGIEVVVLDSQSDGLSQIAEWVATHQGYDAIHVFSHGAEGTVALGSAVLDLATLPERQAELDAIGGALTADGDILLYGCDVAKGSVGLAFLGNLAQRTGADIAASDDITGVSGDWALEQATGPVETVTALTAAAEAAYGADLTFVDGMGGPSADIGFSVAVDGAGNVYVTGYFNGTADFDPGAGVTNLVSNGGNDIFLAKYNAAGALLWANGMGGTANEYSTSVKVDGSGNAYITGNFVATADFDPGAGVTNLTSAGDYDVFLAKYNSAGALVWTDSPPPRCPMPARSCPPA